MSRILKITNNKYIDKCLLSEVNKINTFETTYDYILKTIFAVANPIKKTIIKTECKVHKYININSLNILKNDKYSEEYIFFSSYILDINEGAVWADQDFKSSNHFYNPYKKKMDYMVEKMLGS